ncbi:MAG: calcium/sodium antiporter [Hyphomicrobiales bacterium]
MMPYVYLVGGLFMLMFTGDLLVRGAVGIAERFGIPAIIIGLTVVAFGTSAPELLISLKAAADGAPGIAVGNVVGSNIANVLLVLGLPALLRTTSCEEDGTIRSALFMLAVTLVFIALCMHSPLDRLDGLVLLALLVFFVVDSIRTGLRHRARRDKAAAEIETIDGVEGVPRSTWVTITFLVLGLVGLPIGASLTVDNAVIIARDWGVTDAAIGLTIVAVGTSLPELATTLMAALRRESAVAIGNVIGSNIFNILAIMGATAVIFPIDVPPAILSFDLWAMLAATIVLLPFALAHVPITRWIGLLLVAIYAGYTYLVFQMGAA